MKKKGKIPGDIRTFSGYVSGTAMDSKTILTFLENIIRNARLLMAFLDLKGNVLIWNLAAENITGYGQDEVLGKNEIWKWIYPDSAYRKKVTGTIADIIENERSLQNFETNIQTRSGELKVLSWNTRVLFTDRQEPLGYIVLGEDITDRRNMDIALKKSEEKFRIIADFTYDWEYWLAPDNTFIYVTPSCERVTGYTPDEFYNNPQLFNQITYKEDAPVLAGHMEHIFTSEKPEAIDYRIVRKNGDVIWIAHICQPVFGSNGELLGRRGSNRDITDRKRAEAAVRESNERYLSYIKEAAMRLKTPVEVVGQNIAAMVADIESGDFDRNHVVPQLKLQVKNIEQIRRNIIDLNKTIVDGFGEISPASKKFLTE